jgi:hypothetical protein
MAPSLNSREPIPAYFCGRIEGFQTWDVMVRRCETHFLSAPRAIYRTYA